LEHANDILVAVVKQAGRGDESAQGLLYRQFSKAMFNICMRMADHRQDAEDLLQESFLLAFRSLPQLKEPASFGGWLKRIVINECIRYSKKMVRWQDIEQLPEQADAEEMTDWFREIDIGRVNEEIRKLPAACKAVFNLYVLEEYSHKEIATALGISESTSKSQYHRARQLLRERLVKFEKKKMHG
jgi:RNA polymerase sigma-70 factor (ECF subfamily)